MSKEERYRENIAWLSRLVDEEGYVRVGWTTMKNDSGWTARNEYPTLMRFIGDYNRAAQVSDAITIIVSPDQYAFEMVMKSTHGYRGWPIEIPRIGQRVEKKKVDYARITREIVGDLR